MFASVIKELRNHKGLSQKELAEAVFISPSAISQYENGRAMPSRETLDHLAQFFGVSVNYLLGSSTNAEIERLLTEEFANGVPMSAFILDCSNLALEDRATILKVVQTLSSSDNPSLSHKQEKICR